MFDLMLTSGFKAHLKVQKLNLTRFNKPTLFITRLVLRVSSFFILCLCLLYLCCTTAYAVPDDRGPMGGMISLGGGGYMGTGVDSEGQRLASHLGGSFNLSFGEEVWPRLFLGLGIESHFGQTQDQNYESMFYAFGLEGRYRLSQKQRGLIALAGLGIGGGGFTFKEGESEKNPGGSSGGSVWKIGIGYEIGVSDGPRGLTLVPRLIYQRLGPQMESKVSMDLISLNFELMWTSGRTVSKEIQTQTIKESPKVVLP